MEEFSAMKNGLLLVPFMTGKGGTETVIKNLFTAYHHSTVQSDYRLRVYSIGGSNDYAWARPAKEVTIKHISRRRMVRTLYYLTCLPGYLFRVIKRERPDFIISTNPVMWFLAYRIAHLLKLKTKVIAWYHYSLKRKPVRLLFLHAADDYLAISDAISTELVRAGISRDHIFTIYNPITTDQTVVQRPFAGPTRFIYLGRLDLDGQKNLRDLISACRLLRGEWRLDLYGDETNAQAVKDFAREQHLEPQISFRGFVTKPWQQIKQASALVLCSNFEGYPMVLAEAMSHGVFCIASDIDGSNELVTPSNGSLYKLHDYQDLAAKMQAVIDAPQKIPAQKQIQATVEKLLPQEYLHRFNQAIASILKEKDGVK